MTIVVKQIKPATLKIDAMRLELLNEMRKVGTEIRRDFESTTETWEHKPKFEQAISLTGQGPAVMVETDDEIYRYVDEGTKPHLIPKAGAGLLAFSEGYTAKTVPGVIGSRAGGPYGKRIVRITQVMHPGTDPRNFDRDIQHKWEPLFKRHMEAAMKRAAQKSGNAI